MIPKKPLTVALVSLLSLALADAATSLLVIRDGLLFGRPLPPFGAVTHPKQRIWLEDAGERGLGRFDAELGWTWRPSAASEDGRMHTNRLAARGEREYEREPPAGVRRFVSFGDSFTFGDEVPDRSTYQHVLESADPNLEVLNFGVSGYGTDQALLRYRRIGRLGADVVLIGILFENIGRNVNRYRPLWNPSTGFLAAKPRFRFDENGGLALLPQPFASKRELAEAVEDGTLLARVADGEYWLDRPRLSLLSYSAFARVAGVVVAHRERSPERLWRDPEGEPFRVSLALLETFCREALADGARHALVLLFPSKQDLTGFRGGERFWGELTAELERRGVPYIDLVPPLARRQDELEADPSQGTLYFGGHLSVVGNAVVAREVTAWLAAQDG